MAKLKGSPVDDLVKTILLEEKGGTNMANTDWYTLRYVGTIASVGLAFTVHSIGRRLRALRCRILHREIVNLVGYHGCGANRRIRSKAKQKYFLRQSMPQRAYWLLRSVRITPEVHTKCIGAELTKWLESCRLRSYHLLIPTYGVHLVFCSSLNHCNNFALSTAEYRVAVSSVALFGG